MIELEISENFARWLKGLKDIIAKERIIEKFYQMRHANFGDHKGVGAGVMEIRIPYGPGYRLYYAKLKPNKYLLLLGGTKATQRRDIARSIYLWTLHNERKNYEDQTSGHSGISDKRRFNY